MTETKTGPGSQDGLLELLNDREKLGELIRDGKFGDTIASFVGQWRDQQGEDAREQIRVQVDETMNDMLARKGVQWLSPSDRPDTRLDLTPENITAAWGSGAKLTARYNPAAFGAHVYNDMQATKAKVPDPAELARFLRGASGLGRDQHQGDREWLRSQTVPEVWNDYSSTTPEAGGFLVPEAFRSTIMTLQLEQAIVRPRATVIPMSNARLTIPYNDVTTHAGGTTFGGVTAYWVSEGQSITESEARFGRVTLDPSKLAAYAELPPELANDSGPALVAWVLQTYPQALTFHEDRSFFTGSGVGEPLGFVSCDASVSVAAESGQDAATIVWENITKMYARMLPSSLGRAVWVANINTFPELATMALSVGTGGSPVWLSNGDQGPPMTILGRPVIFTEKASTLGTTGDVNFVDFGYYLIGDRQSIEASSSTDFRFQNDLLALKFLMRVDGRPWIQSALTPVAGDTLTPFVQLATRS